MRLAAALAVTFAAACAAAQEPRAASFPSSPAPTPRPGIETDDACPAPAQELTARCAAPTAPGYGTTPEQPLEWGAAAMGDLWKGRIVCPGGGWPDVKRKGSRAAPNASTSARSPYAKLKPEPDAPDLIDAWTVSCPGRPPETWYANIYRCGNPCPPPPFTLAPAQGEVAFQRAVASVRARDLDGALTAMDAAIAIMPANEKYRSYRGVVLLRLDRPADARTEFEAALAIDPSSAYHRRHRIEALEAEGRIADAGEEWRTLVAKLAPTDEDRPKLLCDHASWLLEHGDDEGAIAGAKAACAAGDERCCR